MHRTLFPALLVLSANLIGCERSTVDNDAVIPISGTVLRQDASAHADDEVRLMRQPAISEALNPAFWIACVAREVIDGSCTAFRTSPTDSAGHYAMEVMGSETKMELGVARRFWLSSTVEGDDGLAKVVLSFKVQREVLDMPDLGFWEEAAGATVSDGEVSFAWNPFTLVHDDSPADSYRLEIDVDDGSAALWRQSATAATSLVLDERILQDASTRFRPAATSTRDIPGSEVVFTHMAGTAGLPSQGHVPLSRGATCLYKNSLGEDAPHSPCPLTDGDFGTLFSKTGDVCETRSGEGQPSDDPEQEGEPDSGGSCVNDDAFEELTIDLGAVEPAELLVLYGRGTSEEALDDVAVEISSDGESYTRLADEVSPYSVIELQQEARFLRFRREVGDGPSSSRLSPLLAEIALY